MKQKLVVVGNGMAGARAVEEILSRGGGDKFEIVMFGDEPHGNYNRILLSNVLNGSQDAKEIFLNPLEWYRDNEILLHAGTRVCEINRDTHEVKARDGFTVSYDKLILATGSRPMIPPMEGLKTSSGEPKPGVFALRTLDDCARIAGYAVKSRRAAVIGGGLLGLEAARGLMQHGAQVEVIHRSGTLMNQQLDAVGGDILKGVIEKMGLGVRLHHDTEAILGDDMVTGLQFRDGSVLECDMVVISCGITPNAELGRDCGLTTERAVVVDDQMRSINDADIYVVGECAQHRGKVYGLVAPLWEQGVVLADHLTGRNPKAAYHGSKLATKLKVMGVELASMGEIDAQDDDEVVQYLEPKRGRYKKLILRDGKLIGAILLGDLDKAAGLMQAFDSGMALPEERSHLLFETNHAKTEAVMLSMPDEAIVCNCNGVSKGTIRQSVEGGAARLLDVMRCTRAGTGCGSCKSLVTEIVDWVNEGKTAEAA